MTTAALQPTATIDQGRDWLRAQLEAGVKCPVCLQRAQMYKRSISSGMAAAMLIFYRRSWEATGDPAQWVDSALVRTELRGSGDYAKLRFWGLLEPHPDEPDADSGKRTSGLWRLTSDGVLFVRSRKSVPSTARVYNNICYGLEGEPIAIVQALRQRFDFHKLMDGTDMGFRDGAADDLPFDQET